MLKQLGAEELYYYLVRLSSILAKCNEEQFAKRILFTSRFISGSATELFGEARIMLVDLKNKKPVVLSDDEKKELNLMIERINKEFEKIGGG